MHSAWQHSAWRTNFVGDALDKSHNFLSSMVLELADLALLFNTSFFLRLRN